MGFTEEQNEHYVKASIRLIQQQILGLMKKIPVVQLQKINATDTDVETSHEILQRYLSESELVEYSIWAWLLMKVKEMT